MLFARIIITGALCCSVVSAFMMGRVSKTAPVFSIKKQDAQLSRNIRLAANIDGADDGVSGPKTSNFTDLQLGLSQLKPFLNIAVPFFKDDKTARNSLFGVVALTLLNSGVSVAFSYISRDFYNALNTRNEAVFYEKIELFFAALLIAVPISVSYRFLREKLSLYWREALTAKVLDKYYAYRTFYQIETLREIDNPDQRISEDVRAFTRTSLDFFITLFTAVIDLFSFSAILYQIYPGLFAAIIAYAGIGSVVTTQLGRSLVGLNYEKLLREADFRFALIRTRENAEAIAFYDSDAKREQALIWTLFKDVLETQLGIVVAQRNLEVFTTSYRYLVQILPSLIVAPLYFAKKVELGTISQSYGAFNHILGDFSILINQFESLSAFSAGLTRLSTFLDKLENSSWAASGYASSNGTDIYRKPLFSMKIQHPIFASSDVVLAVKNLTLLTPDGKRTLLGAIGDPGSTDSIPTPLWGLDGTASAAHHPDGIDFSLSRGDRILVVGPSGAGKSSFIRALSGLWRVGYGEVTWFSSLQPLQPLQSTDPRAPLNGSHYENESAPKDVFFLPQKPYNLLGSLREQIMYPSLGVQVDPANTGTIADIQEKIRSRELDQTLIEILKKVKLENLASRMGGGNELTGLGVSSDWSKVSE
jgi:vitamin B12/bleomycin/antimicrobial peptide transport system ATP-binding/permease protein